MPKKMNKSKFIPIVLTAATIMFFAFSFIRGRSIVQKSEKEINPNLQLVESEAKKYVLKEIDSKTGLIRWDLTAKEGNTENNLQATIINDIKARVYKGKEIVFELTAPHAKANSLTKDISLFGDVTTKDKKGDFLLKSKEISLGMGTSIEAHKGFDLELKNNGTVKGERVLVNDDQSKIIVTKLAEAVFKDIKFSGENVYIERNMSGEIASAIIENGGEITLKNNDTLTAGKIKWDNSGSVEAVSNVIYNSGDKIFKAGYLTISPDKKVFAKNGVSITHAETQCYGDSLSFENNSFVIITGTPRAVQGDKTILADRIIYDVNLKKVQAVGNVRTVTNVKTATNQKV